MALTLALITFAGNFYTNYTLRGPTPESVAKLLAGHSAIVATAQNGQVAVFDEESDQQDDKIISQFASRLSGEFSCPVLAVLNHDDDIFWYQLYVKGELVDSYSSAPNYFGEAEEDSPSGGNAAKLCATFEAGEVEHVEGILRKPSLGEESYAFAVERHADLVETLDLPEFTAGTHFRGLTGGELPEALERGDLIMTKDLAVTPDLSPGYYKVNATPEDSTQRFLKSYPSAWMPGIWAELECREHDLSQEFAKATAAARNQFIALGFKEVGFKKHKRVLNPNFRDSGGVTYLDASRSQIGQLVYNKSTLSSSGNQEHETIVVSFTTVFANKKFSCANAKTPFKPLPHHEVVQVESNDVAFIYQNFVEHLKEHHEKPQLFPDEKSVQIQFDQNARKVFEARVRQGWFVKMSDYEVAMAQRKLPSAPQTT